MATCAFSARIRELARISSLLAPLLPKPADRGIRGGTGSLQGVGQTVLLQGEYLVGAVKLAGTEDLRPMNYVRQF